jgi:aerobic carbon-monoxide dehydrogenase large subunit
MRRKALPGVIAVLTAADLAPLGLHWMPTLAGDKQMVLADGKVLFQGQEVAFVVAKDRYICRRRHRTGRRGLRGTAGDGRSRSSRWNLDDAPVLREDLAGPDQRARTGRGKHHNHIFLWETGEKEATEQVLASADVVAEEMIHYHRTHPLPSGNLRLRGLAWTR